MQVECKREEEKIEGNRGTIIQPNYIWECVWDGNVEKTRWEKMREKKKVFGENPMGSDGE